MPRIECDGHAPQVRDAAFVAPTAVLVGQVTLEPGSSVWYGAVLRADTGRILVGEDSNVQDNAVLHTGPDLDVVIGERVSIGHSAVVHGCTVGDDCLIGMHATVLNGAVVGKGSLIAAGALVTENTVIPPHSLVMGVPGKVRGTVTPEKAAELACSAGVKKLLIGHFSARYEDENVLLDEATKVFSETLLAKEMLCVSV